jgi:hypothetical protein
MVNSMSPVTDPEYNAIKQRRYRERLKFREEAPEAAALLSLTRACLALARGERNRGNPGQIAKRAWPSDRDAFEILTRAPSAPAMTSSSTWAGELAHTTLALLDALTPFSASADLINRALTLEFGAEAKINVPEVVVALADFVAQGSSIPVVDGTTRIACSLEPHEFGVIVTFTRETTESGNAEELTQQVLLESHGPALDRRMFDANPAVPDLRPAGLLWNITPLTATPEATPPAPLNAMMTDLATLAASVAAYAGNGGIAFIAAAKQAVAINLWAPKPFAYPVLASTELDDGTIICIAVNALVSAAGKAPRIETVKSGQVTYLDGGQTEVLQTDAVALRLLWPVSWALRHQGAIAHMTNVTW